MPRTLIGLYTSIYPMRARDGTEGVFKYKVPALASDFPRPTPQGI